MPGSDKNIWTGILEEFNKFDSLLKRIGAITLWHKVNAIKNRILNDDFSQYELPFLDKYAFAIRKFIEYHDVLNDHFQSDTNNLDNRKDRSDIAKNKEKLIAEKKKELLRLIHKAEPMDFDKFIESVDESISLLKKLDELNEKNSRANDSAAKRTYKEGCRAVFSLLKKPNKDKYILMAKSFDSAIRAIELHKQSEFKNAQEHKEEVVTFFANDIPRVVDFKDLGDPEKGYLIGESECLLLQDAVKELGAGRHSKAVVQKLLMEKGITPYHVDKFPYIPGVIIERCKVNLLLNKPNEYECDHNVLYVFMEGNELFYTIKNNKGEIQDYKINKNDLDSEIYNFIIECCEISIEAKQEEKKSDIFCQIVIVDSELVYQALFNLAKKNGHAEHEVCAVYSGKDPEQMGQRKVLGRGNFGEVKAGFNINEKKWQADKVLIEQKGNAYSTKLPKASLEGFLSATFERSKGVITSRKSGKQADTIKHNLTLDYIEGVDLGKFLLAHDHISTIRSLDIAINMINAIEFMHLRRVCHADLSHAGNFMYNPLNGKLFVIDFGKAKKFNEKGEIPFFISRNDYDASLIPPEIKSDVWDVFTEKSELFMLARLLRKVLHANPQLKEDQEVNDLIIRMRATEPGRRPSLTEARRILEIVRKKHAFSDYKKVALLNISDYMMADMPEKKAMIQALKLVDAVTLIDNERKLSPVKYHEIRRMLLVEGVFVENQISFSKDPDALMAKVKVEHQNLEGVVFYYYIYSSNSFSMRHDDVQSIKISAEDQTNYSIRREMSQHAALVSRDDLWKVKKALKISLDQYMKEKSVKRYSATEVSTRIQFTKKPGFFAESKLKKIGKQVAQITRFQQEINAALDRKNGNLTYAHLIRELTQLDREMSGGKNLSVITPSILRVRVVKHEIEENVSMNVLRR